MFIKPIQHISTQKSIPGQPGHSIKPIKVFSSISGSKNVRLGQCKQVESLNNLL